jgi:hypothetical protein
MFKAIFTSLIALSFSTVVVASEAPTKQQLLEQQKLHIENGKSFKDAYAALAYEISHESNGLQQRAPCLKMTRGL